MKAASGTPDAETLALLALAHVIGDEALRPRFLALTGLEPETIRARAQDPVLLGAVLDFLMAHEPDLVAFAEGAGIAPVAVAQLRRELPGGAIDE